MSTIHDFKLLTIIIPTYNRCQQVKENLNLILPQVLKYQDFVRIYVSNNASTDGTSEMIKEYLDKYQETVFYYCQEKNITASPNFNHAVYVVNSEYVYILGDDDIVSPFFLDVFMSFLERFPDVVLFHFNFLQRNQKKTNTKLQFNDCLDDSFIKEFNNGNSFIKNRLNDASFISSNVFKKSCWNFDFNLDELDNCVGYQWYYLLLSGIKNGKCLYFSFPLLLQQEGDAKWYGDKYALYVLMGMSNVFRRLDVAYNEKGLFYQAWLQKLRSKNIFHFLYLTSFNKKFYKMYCKDIKIHLNKIEVFYFLFCLYMPTLFSKIIINFIYFIFKMRKRKWHY